MTETATIKKLRSATEDDVLLALKDSYVGPVLTKPDEHLEFFLRMLDVLLGEEET